MLTAYSRSQFVEKVITDAHGREFKAIFFVTLENGEVKGRLISLRPVVQAILALRGAVTDGSLCLSGRCGSNAVETPYFAYVAPVASPYFSLEVFLSSQPTRAPSRA
jgi:hypothetical protein